LLGPTAPAVGLLGQKNLFRTKYVLDRREVDRRLDELNRERGLLLKIRDKGGVTVVADGDTLITAYNRN
jgi:hypothetical protein